MAQQNYSNHVQFVPLYHYVLAGMIFALLLGSFVNLYKSVGLGTGLYSASLIVIVALCLALLFYLARAFALKAQDRAIRAEENLRHFAMTGKLLDSRLTMGQIIALRFADDEEFLELCSKAAEGNMKQDEIKKTVKNWRADNHRA